MLQFTKLPQELKKMLWSIAKEMRKLESSIRATHVQRVAVLKKKQEE